MLSQFSAATLNCKGGADWRAADNSVSLFPGFGSWQRVLADDEGCKNEQVSNQVAS